jgi:hypothetical protein
VRASAVAGVIVAGWLVTAAVAGASGSPAGSLSDRAVDAAVCSGIAVAFAATAHRRFGPAPAGLPAAAFAVVAVLTISALSMRMTWLPTIEPGAPRGRWLWVGLVAWGVAARQSRDPARR